MNWNLKNKRQAWSGEEAKTRYAPALDKIEMIQTKLFWTDEKRMTILVLQLESIKAD